MGLTIKSVQLETDSHKQVNIQMTPPTQSENSGDDNDEYIPDI